jgi:hypothetical protein
VLRRIHGPKREELVGGRRGTHSEELHNLYTSSDIIRMIKSRRMRWPRRVARMGEMRNVPNNLVGKTKENRPLGRSRRRR